MKYEAAVGMLRALEAIFSGWGKDEDDADLREMAKD